MSQELDARSALRTGLLIGLWIGSILFAYKVSSHYLSLGGLGYDAHAYWLASQVDDPYASAPGDRDAFLYSPAFLQVMKPLSFLPWPVFFAGWMALEVACFVWILRPLGWLWGMPLFLLCTPEIIFGNVYGLLAIMLVLGFRRPGLWAFAFLTKATLGLVGALWFAARREWRALGELVLVSGAITLVSFAAAPQLWLDWFTFLLDNGGSGAAWDRYIRFACAAALLLWGARSDRAWVLPFALLLALPHFTWKNKDFSVLVAALPLYLAARGRHVGSGEDLATAASTKPAANGC